MRALRVYVIFLHKLGKKLVLCVSQKMRGTPLGLPNSNLSILIGILQKATLVLHLWSLNTANDVFVVQILLTPLPMVQCELRKCVANNTNRQIKCILEYFFSIVLGQ
jgi:hypothetical protein